MHRLRTAVAAVAIAALCLLALPACSGFTLEDAHAFRAEAQALREDLARQRDDLAALADALPPESPLRDDTEAALAAADAKGAALAAAIARLDLALDEAADPADGVTIAARGLGALLPEPVRLPLVLGAALVATLLRARQLKSGAASIAASIAKAVKADPDMGAALARHATTLRTIQTPTARRIVDEATRPGPILRLPI